VFGSIPRAEALAVPSRHLGLITAVEHGRAARDAVAAMTDLVARHVDLEAVAGCARATVTEPPWDPGVAEPAAPGVTVALAAGKAFTFGYPEHGELLRAAGAEVVEFDPMTDGLPADTAALVIPGGFPEQHAADLSANATVRQQIARVAALGAPIHAECAGLTYLVDDLDDLPMCGVLSGSARFTERLTLGYRQAIAVTDSALHRAGERVTGHEFHRTAVTFAQRYEPAWRFGAGPTGAVADGAVHRGIHAGYLHTHPAAHPDAIARFVASAARSKLAG
jgi:cobyrinic acid a,c-diamide synthase